MNRRDFLSTSLIPPALAASSALAQAAPSYDMVIKGGQIIDPANEINQPMDVAVLDGKVARVAKDIPAAQAKTTVDAAGSYVTPGLVDMHILQASPLAAMAGQQGRITSMTSRRSSTARK